MINKLSDKVESDAITINGRTVISFPKRYEPLPQYDKRSDLEHPLGDVIRRLAEKAGYKVGDEVEYELSIKRKTTSNPH